MADAAVIKYPNGLADRTAIDPANSGTYKSVNTTFTGGTETPTTGTVASGTGLATGMYAQIVILAGIFAGSYNRLLSNVSGANLTWTPPLPAAPADSDIVRVNHHRKYLVGVPMLGASSTVGIHILQLPSADAGQTANTYRWIEDLPFNATSPTVFNYAGEGFVSIGGL